MQTCYELRMCVEMRIDMKKPYIICHMMISIDGRIDCAMTSKLPGVDDYYTSLDEITVQTTVSGWLCLTGLQCSMM